MESNAVSRYITASVSYDHTVCAYGVNAILNPPKTALKVILVEVNCDFEL